MRKFWTQEEDAELERLYGKLTAAEIGEWLGRTKTSVYLRAATLKLSRTQFDNGPAFDELLRDRHAKGLSDAEIAAEFKCDRHAVGVARRRLGLGVNTLSEHRRDRVRQKTREQLAAAGLSSLAELRSVTFRERARRAGWPEDLRPRAVQILNALWDNGPLTRRQIADIIGMPWKGASKSLCSNDPEGSYLAHLQARGLVVRLGRPVRTGRRGGNVSLYCLPIFTERGNFNGQVASNA